MRKGEGQPLASPSCLRKVLAFLEERKQQHQAQAMQILDGEDRVRFTHMGRGMELNDLIAALSMELKRAEREV